MQHLTVDQLRSVGSHFLKLDSAKMNLIYYPKEYEDQKTDDSFKQAEMHHRPVKSGKTVLNLRKSIIGLENDKQH